jgi:hypothetical protein
MILLLKLVRTERKNVLCTVLHFYVELYLPTKKNDNGDLTHTKLSNISLEIFHIILK